MRRTIKKMMWKITIARLIKQILPIFCLSISNLLYAQNEGDRKLSMTEFINLIQSEPDSVFRLSNAQITVDSVSDQRFYQKAVFDQKKIDPLTDKLIISKSLVLENVHFQEGITFNSMIFEKELKLQNVGGMEFIHCTFKEQFDLRMDDDFNEIMGQLDSRNNIVSSQIHAPVFIAFANGSRNNYSDFQIINSHIQADTTDLESKLWVSLYNAHKNSLLVLEDNTIDLGKHHLLFNLNGDKSSNQNAIIIGNDFHSTEAISLFIENGKVVAIRNNIFPPHVLWRSISLEKSYQIFWPDLAGKLKNETSTMALFLENPYSAEMVNSNRFSSKILKDIVNKYRSESEGVFQQEMLLRGQFIDHYKELRNTSWANSAYIELKDLETERLAYLHTQNPSFETYFTLKINQFLKIFSAYGTKPAKAIVFSMYVIIAFALVYLFFPNHWDSHGKNRIMDRYRFFLKYVNRDSGIHEVYLEEQKHDLLNAEDFKTYLLEQGKTAPKFFMATAMPLYKWSVAGTRTFSWFLEKIDFLKGKWSETEPSKQSGKSVLLITAFLIALTYDILIKMLNALMLSINTFTTLGFGEIPIKGLPRYLAIIQGFIGWFMLTIFSVSLISQLLN